MKFLTLTFLAVAVLFITAQAAVPKKLNTKAFDCTNLPNGLYPNPLDCTTFCKCSNGYTYLYVCAFMDGNGNKLYFDIPTLQCEWPDLARCAGDDCSKGYSGKFDATPGCHGHQYGELYPDPYDCESFYHCEHGPNRTISDCGSYFNCYQSEGILQQCPSGLHFNAVASICDRPENAGCSVR